MGTLSSLAEERTWTSSSGQQVRAEYLSSSSSTVRLKRSSDGKIVSVPLSALVKEDLDYISKRNGKTQASGSLQEPDTAKKPELKPDFINNYEDKWPGLISLDRNFKIEIVEETEEKFVYQSKHFNFISDVRLSNSVIKRFAEIFEATLQYCRALPISSQKAITHNDKQRKQIYLFANKNNYHAAGGPSGSAGVYIGGKDIIMVAMQYLGLKKMGSGFTLDRKKKNRTLPHEITHMFTDFNYFAPGARGWFSEGIAEYIAVTPYRGGKFTVRGNRSDIQEFVTGYGKDGTGGRATGEKIKIGPLKAFMMMPYKKFTANANINYGAGALLVYYFFHMDDGESRKNIIAFMKALQTGKKGDAALKALLNGRSFEQLQEQINKAWRPRGVTFIF